MAEATGTSAGNGGQIVRRTLNLGEGSWVCERENQEQHD
jgi:hypothetical protein